MRALFLACVLLTATPAHAAILAVGKIEDHTGRFTAAQVDQFEVYLAAKITASKSFTVSARTDARELLAKLKSASFEGRYDDRRQLDPGLELPAEKLLDVQLLDEGYSCVVVATLYDLVLATADDAFTRSTECERIHDALDALASFTTGQAIETPRELSADVATIALGYGSTFGGASGVMISGQLFTLAWGPWRATLIDAGTSIQASKEQSLTYAGSTLGLALAMGSHELAISAGPAIYRASAEPDFFSGLKTNADETAGLVAAAIVEASYRLRRDGFGFGGALRAILPTQAERGDPALIMMELSASFGAR